MSPTNDEKFIKMFKNSVKWDLQKAEQIRKKPKIMIWLNDQWDFANSDFFDYDGWAAKLEKHAEKMTAAINKFENGGSIDEWDDEE